MPLWPPGKFSPGASNNVGSGYWGNNFATGTTFYVTKNKGTSLNLATDWEIHGQKRGINITLGQAFTDEWELGTGSSFEEGLQPATPTGR